ncbi:heme ABC transporter ATP-binding protein [Roseomonas stagni]|uniref:Heme ABC transporter ATP-binding protein n=1 Tax=Falsiroseomonas algicola TaxID=2716930 RepID=A0A6M1LHC8_9PROT|nr:heme ABC transporter ATP-binding protein [Falsiroseomonas algicola]NGM19775.1 heme ABC transporter ATP-binding protein [Falsiroseomonas algicola]
MIAAQAITFRAGGRALLRDVSLELAPGQVTAVVGPNGAGKSTLLRVLSGELRPDQGVVSLDRRPIGAFHPRDLARRRAVVSQAVALAFPMTAREVVGLGRLPWHATPGAARDDAAIAAALDAVDAAGLAQQRYATLSGGERQRIQIARALAQIDGAPRPAALLLDEPTASLDVRHVGTVLRLLKRLAADGVAVMVVLHDLNEAAFVADQVAVVAGGWRNALGPAAAILRPPLLEAVYGVPFAGGEGALRPDFSNPASYRVPTA